MKNTIITVIISFLVLITNVVFGQKADKYAPTDPTQIYQVELNDGSKFLGYILQKDSSLLIMKTSSLPKLEIPLGTVLAIDLVKPGQIKNGSIWFENPHATRYLFGPSAINLKKREMYYQNTWLFLNSFNVGVTDHFSIGGGVEFLSTTFSLASGNFNPIFIITPKIGYQVAEKVYAGGGILYANIPSSGAAGIAYGISTVGTLNHNFTGGLGWGFIDGSFSSRPIITFSTMLRTSRRTAFVSENWIVPTNGYYGVFSYGLRFFSENMAVDFALLNNPDISSWFALGIPFVSFTLKF